MGNNKRKLKRYLFIFNQPIESEETIGKKTVFKVIKELEKISTKKEETRVDLLLDSPGGDIYSAYKIINILRSKCKQLIIIIPYRAKSAATLMALSADSIIMGPQSEIGPLDLPMEHPLLEGIGPLSALDGIRPLEFLANKSFKMGYDVGKVIRREIGLGRKDSIQIALKFATDYMNPITTKLEPWLINMCERELCIAEEYSIEFLKKFMFKDQKKAEEIADTLVRGYPEHGFSISADRAKELGLEITDSTKFDKWDNAWNIYLELPIEKETIKLYDKYENKIIEKETSKPKDI